MSTSNFKAEFLGGARAGVPVVLGFIPVGIAFGIMARQAGFEIWQTCGFSSKTNLTVSLQNKSEGLKILMQMP